MIFLEHMTASAAICSLFATMSVLSVIVLRYNGNPRLSPLDGLRRRMVRMDSNLRDSILLMTATMNIDLLTIFENMVGIRVHLHNYLWINTSNMRRRDIKIDVSFSVQRL